MVNTSDILPNTPRYLKVPLIFFNTVLWVLGVVLIALGGYSLNELTTVKELVDFTLPAGIIVLGVFVFVLTIVGCAVAYKEKLVGLIFYTVIMIILLICLIGVGGAIFHERNNLRQTFTTAFFHSGPTVQNEVENYFHCCGWSVYNDSYHPLTTDQYNKGTYHCVQPVPNNTCVNYTSCASPTSAPTSAPTALPTSAPTSEPTSAPTSEPTETPTSAPTETPTPTPQSKRFGRAENDTTPAPTEEPTAAPTPTPTPTPEPNCNRTCTVWSNTTYYIVKQADEMDAEGFKRCDEIVIQYTQDRLYVAGVAGVVVGVIEFVCMLFSLFLIVRLCRSPRARTYE